MSEIQADNELQHSKAKLRAVAIATFVFCSCCFVLMCHAVSVAVVAARITTAVAVPQQQQAIRSSCSSRLLFEGYKRNKSYKRNIFFQILGGRGDVLFQVAKAIYHEEATGKKLNLKTERKSEQNRLFRFHRNSNPRCIQEVRVTIGKTIQTCCLYMANFPKRCSVCLFNKLCPAAEARPHRYPRKQSKNRHFSW